MREIFLGVTVLKSAWWMHGKDTKIPWGSGTVVELVSCLCWCICLGRCVLGVGWLGMASSVCHRGMILQLAFTLYLGDVVVAQQCCVVIVVAGSVMDCV